MAEDNTLELLGEDDRLLSRERKQFRPKKNSHCIGDCSEAFETDLDQEQSTIFTDRKIKPGVFKHKKGQLQVSNFSRAFDDSNNSTNLNIKAPISFRPRRLVPQSSPSVSNFSNVFSPAQASKQALYSSEQPANNVNSGGSAYDDPFDDSAEKTISKRCSKILDSAQKLRLQYKTVTVQSFESEACLEEEEVDSSRSSGDGENPSVKFCETLRAISPIFPITPDEEGSIVCESVEGNNTQEDTSSCLSINSFDSDIAARKFLNLSNDFTPILNDISTNCAKKIIHKKSHNSDTISVTYNVTDFNSSSFNSSLENSTNSNKDVRKKVEKSSENFDVLKLPAKNILRSKKPAKKKTSFTAHDLSIQLLTKGAVRKKSLPITETFFEPPRGKENKDTKRPAYWATNKLYSFLKNKLEPEHGAKWNQIAINFVCSLSDTVLKTQNLSDPKMRYHLTKTLKADFINLKVVNCDFEFYHFIFTFLPDEYVNIVVPSIQPYSEKINVPFKPKNLFRKYF